MFRSPTHRPPDGPFNQPLHLTALLVDLGKHETLELGIDRIDLDSARHTRRQLVSIAEEFVTSKIEHRVNTMIRSSMKMDQDVN
jgi:hypothetical protein